MLDESAPTLIALSTHNQFLLFPLDSKQDEATLPFTASASLQTEPVVFIAEESLLERQPKTEKLRCPTTLEVLLIAKATCFTVSYLFTSNNLQLRQLLL
jgi:hypothetical protein